MSVQNIYEEAEAILCLGDMGRITVLPCDALLLDAALKRHVKDYEDMLQYQCALAAGCDVIVTVRRAT